MTLYSKFIFLIIIFNVYFLTSVFSRTNNIRAIQKVIIFFFLVMMLSAIIFPETIVIGLANLLGVGRGPDAILYLFIIISLAFNLIFLRKLNLANEKINKVIQYISIKEGIVKK